MTTSWDYYADLIDPPTPDVWATAMTADDKRGWR